jgi:hypothetical protein
MRCRGRFIILAQNPTPHTAVHCERAVHSGRRATQGRDRTATRWNWREGRRLRSESRGASRRLASAHQVICLEAEACVNPHLREREVVVHGAHQLFAVPEHLCACVSPEQPTHTVSSHDAGSARPLGAAPRRGMVWVGVCVRQSDDCGTGASHAL